MQYFAKRFKYLIVFITLVQVVNAQQKSNIKDLICQQAGYLRIVLQQKDIL